jgi:hypothetical protein
MSDEEIEKALDEMRSMFGELPNPEHEPRRFAWYVKLWKYYKTVE